MYRRTYELCHYDNSRVTLSNRHFLPFRAPEYVPRALPGEQVSLGAGRLSLDPKEWGPVAWDFLFYVARSYSPSPTAQDREAMLAFLRSLEYALPCESCRRHFALALARLTTADLSGPDALSDWLENLREKIHERKRASEAHEKPKAPGAKPRGKPEAAVCKTCEASRQ